MWGTILILGLITGGAWIALSPPLVFKIRITNGTLRVTKGKVGHGCLQEFGEIVRREEIPRGWIGGVKRGRRLTLVFSRSIPPGCRQQIRNLWTNV